jgi:hypothetical protein
MLMGPRLPDEAISCDRAEGITILERVQFRLLLRTQTKSLYCPHHKAGRMGLTVREPFALAGRCNVRCPRRGGVLCAAVKKHVPQVDTPNMPLLAKPSRLK